ncbi:RNA helicase [Candidatus Tenderia electrophaga]|jgi:ATP-dependent RNA helicase DeaD|uniref:ATP-dependent RNA helicase DeaD n=1 Tax=Candidatus Tenderia electrophaga TaxID=1748243 RepID=A0A0S2TEA3_9GAMM|nr:RNA helicase [Candidatus Tenderia electrophaga]
MSAPQSSIQSFSELGLNPSVLQAVIEVGYETPSPIQAETIPYLLQGRDVLGQAQTGTGKTAAFALPLLSRIDLKRLAPQVLVLAPTRELAIQVAEAFQTYASNMKGFHVAPIYGGQSYETQIRQLKRGVHVVVGTPGRVMDHMRKGTLKLDGLSTLVLDEADEMLRMGFIDDVEWVLEQTPPKRQVALFSATMPAVIRKIAERHLNNPEQITIKVKTTTAETIRQRYWMVSGLHKLDALTRLLEVESFDGMLVFVRTKNAAAELAEKLEARGHAAAALTGDMIQKQRERTVEQLKSGKLDILVATDVVARGLDVERITHVINYDIPYDTESYTHRIGRTGRAGRKGDAILFVAPREKRMLHTIEKATRQKIEQVELPSTATINDKRIERFNQRITDTLSENNLEFFQQLMENYQQEHNVPALEIAAALAKMVQGNQPLLLKERQIPAPHPTKSFAQGERPDKRKPKSERPKKSGPPEAGMVRFRLEVGHKDKVKPGNIVGAIANEAGLDSEHIGRIEIFDDYSLVDLPEGMPKDVFNDLHKAWVAGKQLRVSKFGQDTPGRDFSAKGKSKKHAPAKPAKRAGDKPKKKLKHRGK